MAMVSGSAGERFAAERAAPGPRTAARRRGRRGGVPSPRARVWRVDRGAAAEEFLDLGGAGGAVGARRAGRTGSVCRVRVVPSAGRAAVEQGAGRG